MVGFDASVLTLVINPISDIPKDPGTGAPVVRAQERVSHLIGQLEAQGSQIVVPTPVLSEVLVRTGQSGLRYVEILDKSETFVVAPFNTVAAVELAEITRRALMAGDKRDGSSEPYQKIKLDRQIAAICKVSGAHTLDAADRSLAKFAESIGLTVVGIHDLPLPPSPPQGDMFEEAHSFDANSKDNSRQQ